MGKMCLSRLARISILIAVAAISAFSQKVAPVATQVSISPPGKINLPVGYRYEPRKGIDSKVGSIVRADGFTINHDIGRMAGNYAYKYFPENFANLRRQTHLNANSIETDIRVLQDKIDWRQQQKVNGDDLMLVLLKDSTIIASFVNSNANFSARADSSDKVADFLMIVLTYQPDEDKRH